MRSVIGSRPEVSSSISYNWHTSRVAPSHCAASHNKHALKSLIAANGVSCVIESQERQDGSNKIAYGFSTLEAKPKQKAPCMLLHDVMMGGRTKMLQSSIVVLIFLPSVS